MSIIPDLALDFPDELPEPVARPFRSWTGLAIENAAIETTNPYGFQWSGATHYLALHDVILDDTTMKVDDFAPDHTLDLRDTLTFLPHGCSVEGWSTPAERANGFTVLYFAPSLLNEELELRYQAASPRPVIYGRDVNLIGTMRKLSALVADAYTDNIYAESACILAAIETLALKPPETRGSLTPRQISTVTEYMDAHLTEDIGLAELASAVNLSRYHFGRAFKATTGQSPYAFLLHRRVERATALLASSKLSLQEVATQAGFTGLAQLRRHFLQLRGQTPMAFRRALR